jgi:hypothetical protein
MECRTTYYTALQVVTRPAEEDLLFYNGLLGRHLVALGVCPSRDVDKRAIEHWGGRKSRPSCGRPKGR